MNDEAEEKASRKLTGMARAAKIRALF